MLAAGFIRAGCGTTYAPAVQSGFAGAGAMVSMLWNLPPDPRDAELPLRFISAAPIAADLYREHREALRLPRS